MSSFRPESYMEAKALYKPLKRSRMPNSPSMSLKATHALRGAQGTRTNAIKPKADPLLAKWGRAIKKRDGNKCQWRAFGPCATGDIRIDPHHISPRGRRPDLKYVETNGVSLCRTHHDWVHDHPINAESMGLLSSESYEKARKQT